VDNYCNLKDGLLVVVIKGVNGEARIVKIPDMNCRATVRIEYGANRDNKPGFWEIYISERGQD
jgi:hypothetical protein